MTAKVQEQIKSRIKAWFADYGINMALYDRGYLTYEEGDVSCAVSFKRLDGKEFELVADDVFFDEKGRILQCELNLR